MSRFRLFPEETHFWSFNDYAAVLAVMAERQPARVLEFGPGSSTLALIEGGARQIDTCEDQSDWFAVYADRLARRFPSIVTLHPYELGEPFTVPALEGRTYDLAVVDGPHNPAMRLPVIAWCLQRSAAVLVPTEDVVHSLRTALEALSVEMGRAVRIWDTGAPSGGFALFTQEALCV